MLHTPFYNPLKTYEENFYEGPFSNFADGKKLKQKGKPNIKIFGHSIYLPFGIPAGPLLNAKYIMAALDKGFDLVTYKTVRSKKYPCSPWPNVLSIQVKEDLTISMAEDGVLGNQNYTEPLAITNSFGVPSFDPDFWQKDMQKASHYAKKGQLVIGSFQGTTNATGDIKAYIKDFVKAAELVKETDVSVMEVNLSCPNEGTAHLLCFDIPRAKDVVFAIKEKIGNTPLIIKIAYFENENQLSSLIKEVGKMIEGIEAINTIPAKILDENGNQALPGGESRLRAGVCGYPIKWAGLSMVQRLKNLRDDLGLDYAIIGVGGVTTPKEYNQYKKIGADAVMSATGAMWNPLLAEEIKKQIK